MRRRYCKPQYGDSRAIRGQSVSGAFRDRQLDFVQSRSIRRTRSRSRARAVAFMGFCVSRKFKLRRRANLRALRGEKEKGAGYKATFAPSYMAQSLIKKRICSPGTAERANERDSGGGRSVASRSEGKRAPRVPREKPFAIDKKVLYVTIHVTIFARLARVPESHLSETSRVSRCSVSGRGADKRRG